jgi:hypothetical protein
MIIFWFSKYCSFADSRELWVVGSGRIDLVLRAKTVSRVFVFVGWMVE